MRRLIESVEVEYLHHNIVNYGEKVTSVTEFNLITVFYWQVLITEELILKDVDESNFIWECDDQVKSRRVEG